MDKKGLQTIKPSKHLEQIIVDLEKLKYEIADTVRTLYLSGDLKAEGSFTEPLTDLEHKVAAELRQLHSYLWETNQ